MMSVHFIKYNNATHPDLLHLQASRERKCHFSVSFFCHFGNFEYICTEKAKTVMKKSHTGILLGWSALIISALMSIPTTAATAADKTIELKVIETSDVHGYFFPYDFMEKRPLSGTLSRANSYISRQRRQYGDRLLLIDNGDILQGQPCSYWSNVVMPQDMNLAASIINYMGYDAETIGNHDIEPGHKVYDKWIREVRCPLLGANIIDRATQQPYVQPYSVHYKDGVKIVIIGMITPAIPNWLNESVWERD